MVTEKSCLEHRRQTLESSIKDLREELAVLCKTIEAKENPDYPFKPGEDYYFAYTTHLGENFIEWDREEVEEDEIKYNPKALLMFKNLEQLEAFTPKITEVAEREARLLYSKLSKPVPDIKALVRFEVLTKEKYKNKKIETETLIAVRNYCQDMLDYMQQMANAEGRC